MFFFWMQGLFNKKIAKKMEILKKKFTQNFSCLYILHCGLDIIYD